MQVPSLNDTPLHTLKPNSLVRFRCMVQDIYDPEFYLGLYQVKDLETSKVTQKSGMYKDIADCSVSLHEGCYVLVIKIHNILHYKKLSLCYYYKKILVALTFSAYLNVDLD